MRKTILTVFLNTVYY